MGFVFLVALGIDYNIFLMTRVREETERLGHTRGVLAGLTGTGGVITSAGVVLAATFAVLPLVTMAQLGVLVGVGVLLDTFLVRTVLVPALALDIGPKVWWPGALSRAASPDSAGGPPARGGTGRRVNPRPHLRTRTLVRAASPRSLASTCSCPHAGASPRSVTARGRAPTPRPSRRPPPNHPYRHLDPRPVAAAPMRGCRRTPPAEPNPPPGSVPHRTPRDTGARTALDEVSAPWRRRSPCLARERSARHCSAA